MAADKTDKTVAKDKYVWNDRISALHMNGKFYHFSDPVPVEQLPSEKRLDRFVDRKCLLRVGSKEHKAQLAALAAQR